MSQNEDRMPLGEAIELAGFISNEMGQFCDKFRVAGSVRRRRQTIGDIELVIIPKLLDAPTIGQASLINELPDVHVQLPKKNLTFLALDELTQIYQGRQFRYKLNDQGNPAKNGEKYKQFEIRREGMEERWVTVDIFFATPENFGLIFLLRTGPSDFSKYMLTRQAVGGALPNTHHCENGYLWRHPTKNEAKNQPDIGRYLVNTFAEKDVFDVCKLASIGAEHRDSWKQIYLDKTVVDAHEDSEPMERTLHGFDDELKTRPLNNDGWETI